MDCTIDVLIPAVTADIAVVATGPSLPSAPTDEVSDVAKDVADAAAIVIPSEKTIIAADVAIIGLASSVIAVVNGATAVDNLTNAAAVWRRHRVDTCRACLKGNN